NAGRIPDELLPRLFEPFKASFHDSRGLGLGLFIASEFARAHGGALAARNLDGEVLLETALQRRIR
ncbi:MAG: sensor histidine kinase, partial [Stenotrophomonas sp.]